MRVLRVGLLLASAALVAALATTAGHAQGQGSGANAPASSHLLVQVWHVKPDMLATFRELVSKQLLPAQQKGGLQYRWTWSDTPMGGSGFTFVSTQPVANYAQFGLGPAGRRGMGDAAWNDYNTKLRTTLTGTESYIYTARPELTIRSGASTAPPFVEVTEWQALTGKTDEFVRVMSGEYLPAYRKAGVKDLWTYGVDYGETPANHFVFVRAVTKYDEFDGPGLLTRGGLTPAASTELGRRRGETATGMNRRVYQFVPELSFGSPSSAVPTR